MFMKIFSFFAYLASKFEKLLIWPKKFSFNQKRYQKTQNLTLISNPLEKFVKNLPKKVIRKMWGKYALFLLLLMFIKLVFLITFWGEFFWDFSTDLKTSWNFAFFISFLTFSKLVFFVILVLFTKFEAKRAKTAPKIKISIM